MRALALFPVSSRSLWPAGAALVAALLMTGCGSSSDSSTSGTSKPSSTPTSTPTSKVTEHASPSKPADTRTTPAPSPPPTAPPPSASDGTRYSACADGTCEVAVARPVRINVGGGTLSVTEVKPEDSLHYKLAFAAGGAGSGTLKGTCGGVSTFYRSGGISATTCADGVNSTPEPPAPEPGALSMQLVGWNSDHAAVLRLVSG